MLFRRPSTHLGPCVFASSGSGIAGGVSTTAPGGGGPAAGSGPPGQPPVLMGGDRYAALAALDTVFSPPAPATSVYNPTSTSQG